MIRIDVSLTFPGSSLTYSFSFFEEPFMKNGNRAKIVHVLVFAVLLLASTSWAQTPSPVAEKIAKTYGVDSWSQVEAIRYTWSGEIPGVFKLSRTWTWDPKTSQPTYQSKDKDGKPVMVTHTSKQLCS